MPQTELPTKSVARKTLPLTKKTETTPNVEDWSRDVESTAKALEGKDVSDIDKKIEKVYHGTSYDIEKPTIEKYGQVHDRGRNVR